MEEEILLERRGAVAEIVLNRPQKLNAVTPAMAERLDTIARQVQRDGDVRVILLRGNGERAFCSGSDLRALETYPSAWRFRNRFEYAAAIRGIRKPVIAALHGWVLGGGAEMALSADVRFMARSSKFGFPEVTRGWVGGGGATQILPRIIGYGQAMRLLLSGDPIDAEEALRLGVVESVVDDDKVLDAARSFCAKLANFSPVAVESVKAAVRMSANATLETGCVYENEMNTLCFSAGDHMEGIQAFKDKRQAEFSK